MVAECYRRAVAGHGLIAGAMRVAPATAVVLLALWPLAAGAQVGVGTPGPDALRVPGTAGGRLSGGGGPDTLTRG
jgi:hypothetical protein